MEPKIKPHPLLRFRQAAVGYGKRAVLTGVGFEISPGSFVGILGHNGSGKTTLLRTILGIIPCLKGEFIMSLPQGGAPRCGYVPQKETLDPLYPLSARDVVAMGTHRHFNLWRRLRGAGDAPLVRQCLHACGASELAGKRFSELSGGQKQRVLIARALAAEPDILILDEPLAGIDITTQKALIGLFKRFKEDGLTVLMVSHRIQSEKGLFSHIAWVDEGKAAMGPAEEMLKGKIAEVFRSELAI